MNLFVHFNAYCLLTAEKEIKETTPCSDPSVCPLDRKCVEKGQKAECISKCDGGPCVNTPNGRCVIDFRYNAICQ